MVDVDSVRWMLEVMPDAALLVNREQKIVLLNSALCRMFGYEAEELVGEDLGILIPAEARVRHSGHFSNYLSAPRMRPMGTGFHFHGQRSNGEIFPVDIMLNRLECCDQEVVMAVIRDDSDRAAVENLRRKLEKANHRLQRAQSLGKLGWWEARLQEKSLIWSSGLRGVLRLSDDVTPSFDEIAAVCHPDDREALIADFDQLKSLATHRIEYRVQKNDDEVIWVEEEIEPLAERPEKSVVLGIVRDITEQKELEQRLLRESVTDGLTTLFNRRMFSHELKARFSEYARSGTLFALILYDFDFFKTINDEYGHAAGDAVLAQASDRVRGQLRASDNAYRIGGEEFAVILPATDKNDAMVLAERLRASIAGRPFNVDSGPVMASITAGVAVVAADDSSIEGIFKRADEALYRGKALSRNRVAG